MLGKILAVIEIIKFAIKAGSQIKGMIDDIKDPAPEKAHITEESMIDMLGTVQKVARYAKNKDELKAVKSAAELAPALHRKANKEK